MTSHFRCGLLCNLLLLVFELFKVAVYIHIYIQMDNKIRTNIIKKLYNIKITKNRVNHSPI
jgi:hypothetical protein